MSLPKLVAMSVGNDIDDADPYACIESLVSLFNIEANCSFQLCPHQVISNSCFQIHQNSMDLQSYVGKIIFNRRKMCANCCMKIIVATTSFDYFRLNFNLALMPFYQIMKHPQILFHFTRKKHKHLFTKIICMLGEYGWYGFPGRESTFFNIEIKYSFKEQSRIEIADKIRNKFWMMLELCHSRKCLLHLIKCRNGKYFHEIFMKTIMDHRDKHKLKNIVYVVSVLIIIRHRAYFKKKIEKYPNKQCYKYLNHFVKAFPDRYIDMNLAKEKRIRSRKEILSIHRKYIYCNNAKCNAKYANSDYKKWYKCKGCKIAFYCSRRCQKYDWNKYAHRHLCSYFDLTAPNNPHRQYLGSCKCG